MTARTRPTATFGTTMGGVRYATAPRHDLRAHVGAYAPTGFENAPVEGMDDPSGTRFLRGLVNGLAITAMAAAVVLFVVVPLLRWALA